MKRSYCQIMVVAILLALLAGGAFGQKSNGANERGVLDPVERKTNLYPADADAQNEIDNALKSAATQHKRVMLLFGANWCYDCHVLDRALHEGRAGKIMQVSFLLVHVNIGEGDKNPELVKKYSIPVEKGIPAVTILDTDGKVLFRADGEFEAARQMMKQDLVAFLNRWKVNSQ